MAASRLVLTRAYDLPPAIVWDGLVDPVLIEGWWGTATLEARAGGRFALASPLPAVLPDLEGRVAAIVPNRVLGIETAQLGEVRFDLEATPGGTRGTSTLLSLTLSGEAWAAPTLAARAYWLTCLDALADLLRGHPVEWAEWERDYGPTWRAHLVQLSRSSAR